MTPEDLALDPNILFGVSAIIVYRLARTRYANLSGVGAAIAAGRWNLSGEEAIYTSINVAVPQLERLVHTPKDLIPANLAMMKIRLSGDWKRASEPEPERAAGMDEVYRRASEAFTIQFVIESVLDDATTQVWYDTNSDDLICVCPSIALAKRCFATALPEIRDAVSLLALAAPSVISPAWNLVLYPAARGFKDHVSLESVDPFEFDPRLFPENTPIEAGE